MLLKKEKSKTPAAVRRRLLTVSGMFTRLMKNSSIKALYLHSRNFRFSVCSAATNSLAHTLVVVFLCFS